MTKNWHLTLCLFISSFWWLKVDHRFPSNTRNRDFAQIPVVLLHQAMVLDTQEHLSHCRHPVWHFFLQERTHVLLRCTTRIRRSFAFDFRILVKLFHSWNERGSCIGYRRISYYCQLIHCQIVFIPISYYDNCKPHPICDLRSISCCFANSCYSQSCSHFVAQYFRVQGSCCDQPGLSWLTWVI